MNKSYLSPKEVAQSWIEIGKNKIGYSFINIFFLAVLGGFFIGLGGHGNLVVTQTLGHFDVGFAKFMGAAVFPVGIMLVVFAGGELYTGNALIGSAWANGDVKLSKYMINLAIVFVGNLVGSLILVYILYAGDVYTGDLATKAIAVAEAKSSLTFTQAFMRGILCNVLVAGAVYIQVAATDAAGKILALWFPVMLFVLSGYEHVVANMFFIPMGAAVGANLDWMAVVVNNMIPVALGNLVGGSLFIAIIYWFIYVKGSKK
jgi:formate/nitrite transporter